ncbi:hypothetical protein WJX79_005205 [Trebouxia sp. C0005]
MKGSNGRANASANAFEPSASQRGMQSSLNAQPFIPDMGPSSSSPSPRGNVRGSNPYSLTNSAGTTSGSANSSSTKLSLAAVNAAPFVPGSTLQDQAAPRSFAAPGFGQRELPQPKPSLFGGAGRGYLGQAQAAAWALPDGDDLLGLTAHTPGQPLQPPATPVQDGRLDRAAADTANIQSPARAYNSSYQDQQAAGGRGRGSGARGRQAASSSPARVAAPSPDRASPMYGRGAGRGAAQRRGFVGSSDNGIAYGMPAGQAQQMQMQYMRDQLRQELQQRSFLSHAQAERRPEEFGLPDMVQQYHSLFPLEDLQAAEQPSAAFGVCTALLRAASPLLQGQAVTLRRMDPRQVAPSQAVLMSGQEAVETWRPLAHHPGLICPRAAFVSDEVGGRPSLFFVHEHMPGAVTLEQAHMQPQSGPAGLQRAPAAEQQLWTYLTQLAAALRTVHVAGCAVGASGLAPSKVLLTSRVTARIKIGSIGVLHTLRALRGRREDIPLQQQEDIAAIGPLMVHLAGGAAGASALQALAGHLSPHLLHLLASLQNAHIRDCHTLCAAVHEHALEMMEGQMMQQDTLMAQLSQEMDNGRLLRLLSRLVMVSEGNQTSLEPNWSETGDRYLIKLFRDFVFHQVNEAGRPLLDWGHVIEALNKLDLGVSEKIMLLSRDEMSMLLVSYADIKQCINTTFKELEARAGR